MYVNMYTNVCKYIHKCTCFSLLLLAYACFCLFLQASARFSLLQLASAGFSLLYIHTHSTKHTKNRDIQKMLRNSHMSQRASRSFCQDRFFLHVLTLLKALQRLLKFASRRSDMLHAILIDFWSILVTFWVELGSPNRSKIDKNSMLSRCSNHMLLNFDFRHLFGWILYTC